MDWFFAGEGRCRSGELFGGSIESARTKHRILSCGPPRIRSSRVLPSLSPRLREAVKWAFPRTLGREWVKQLAKPYAAGVARKNSCAIEHETEL